MMALDDPNMFKYKPQTTNTQPMLLANCYINLSKTNPTTLQNENFGQHIFALQFHKNNLSITIYKQGCTPAVQFNISKSLHWTFQNRVYCYFHDDKNNQWLASFQEDATAAYVTSVIYCLTKNIRTDTLNSIDIAKPEGKGISANDTLQVSYYIYPAKDFPIIERECVSLEVKKVKFTKENLISGIYNSITGMVSGSTKLIYVPQAYTLYENGSSNSSIPATNVVVLFSVHHVKFDGTDNQSDVSDCPTSPEKSAPPPPPEKSDTEVTESDKSAEDEKLERLRKLQKMGAKNSFIPRVEVPTAVSSTSSRGPSTAALKRMEANINNQIDEIVSDPKLGEVISGVIALAMQLKQKQEEVNKLKSELQNITKSGAGGVTKKQIEFARAEAEDMRNKYEYTERKIKDAQAKLAEAGKDKFDADTAKAKGKSMIKSLMNDIFNEISDIIDPEEEYDGADVNQKLFELLRKHSFAAIEEVNKNGLQ